MSTPPLQQLKATLHDLRAQYPDQGQPLLEQLEQQSHDIEDLLFNGIGQLAGISNGLSTALALLDGNEHISAHGLHDLLQPLNRQLEQAIEQVQQLL